MHIISKGEKTRSLLIEKATILFTRQGYSRTSLNQILEATGLTKGGFYFHFKSKEDLGIAVIAFLEECWTRQVLPRMLDGKDAREKLELMFSEPGDCCLQQEFRPTILLMTLATEMMEVYPKFSSMLQRIIKGWWIVIEAIIEEGKLEKLFRDEVDSNAVAAIILSNIMGANLLSVLNNKTELYDKQLQSLKTVLFHGITAAGAA